MGGEWLNVKIKFGALAAIVLERRECQLSVASDEGTSGWRGQQLEGDHLLKGVVCIQNAGYPLLAWWEQREGTGRTRW